MERENMSTAETTAIAEKKAPRTIKELILTDGFRQSVADALPKHLTVERFLRVALTALTRTPKLAKCDEKSFFSALLTLSQLGIEPDGRRAHLIPFENRKKNITEVQLIIDYKGLVEIVLRSGLVSKIHSDAVCENDDFLYDRGEVVRHKIDFRRDRGQVYAVYALCRLKDGSESSEVMSRQDVERIRGRSRSGKDGPWVTDWNEMAKKTVFRRLSKWLPWSPEIRDALSADLESDGAETIESVARTAIERGASRSDDLASMLAEQGHLQEMEKESAAQDHEKQSGDERSGVDVAEAIAAQIAECTTIGDVNVLCAGPGCTIQEAFQDEAITKAEIDELVALGRKRRDDIIAAGLKDTPPKKGALV